MKTWAHRLVAAANQHLINHPTGITTGLVKGNPPGPLGHSERVRSEFRAAHSMVDCLDPVHFKPCGTMKCLPEIVAQLPSFLSRHGPCRGLPISCPIL
jgi:hypothetical protein